MNSNQLRKEFLKFFQEKKHTLVSSSSLVPTDNSVLFTTAGMQQFKEYYLGKPSPYGKKTTSCQKCFRTSDIEQVGDKSHLTFLEMLGNFSFGHYFKKEAIEWALELLTTKFQIPISKLWITVFGGEGEIKEDSESKHLWQKLGIAKERISSCGKKDNFWGPTGLSGPCGPTTEIHYDLTEKPCLKGKNCQPNCQCGRFLEIWNLVFNQYFQDQNKKLSLLEQKGVDTGMGLERLAMVVQQKPSLYETDLFFPIIEELNAKFKAQNSQLQSKIQNLERIKRIIADHTKSAVFLISEDILPSNVERGYILRRLLRRVFRYAKLLDLKAAWYVSLIKKVIEIYQEPYPELRAKQAEIITVWQKEEEKFSYVLEKGLRQFEKIIKSKENKGKIISGKEAFNLYQSYGFPLELTEELARERNFRVDRQGFVKAQREHQKISRAGAEKKFGGIGKEAGYQAIKLHTATHLLHAALREILGPKVQQRGSDITEERLRFDFSFERKLTTDELKKVEDLVNQKIKENLPVKKEEMSKQEALRQGAVAFFKEKYPERVTVYYIDNFSKEICAGPHVERTGELEHFSIIKEESSGAGTRRIKAVLLKE